MTKIGNNPRCSTHHLILVTLQVKGGTGKWDEKVTFYAARHPDVPRNFNWDLMELNLLGPGKCISTKILQAFVAEKNGQTLAATLYILFG